MATITILFFLLISFFLSHLVFERKNVFFIFRTLGLISTVIVVSSFYLGYLRIPINLFSFSVLIAAISSIIILIHREKTKSSFWKVIKGGKNFDRKRFVLLSIVVIVSVLLSWSYFGIDFKAPQFAGVDPAAHFLLGKYVFDHDQLVFFNRDLVFHDTDLYPFGSSVMLAVFREAFPFVSFTSIFTLVNILFYILIGSYFIIITEKYYAIRSKILLFLYVILIQLGFFFTLLTMGFWSQAIGLFLLLFFVDIYSPKKLTIPYLLLYGAIITAIFFTYTYWLPIVILFIIFRHAAKKYLIKDFLVRLFLILFISFLLASPYIIAQIKANLLSYASADGGTYKVFFLNFVFFTIFAVFGIILMIQDWRKSPKNFSSFFLSSLAYFSALLIFYIAGRASAYTFAKNFFLIGPLLYFVSIVSLENIFHRLEKPNRIVLTSLTFIIITYLIAHSYFETKPRSSFDRTSFQPNFWSLKGQVFDVYFNNARMIQYNGKFSPHKRLAGNNFGFISNIAAHVPPQYHSNRIMVIADGEVSLWFYALTNIWPRTSIDNDDSVWILPSYESWARQSSSPLLVLLDTEMTRQWKQDNNFNIKNFEVLYREKNNYLLKKK